MGIAGGAFKKGQRHTDFRLAPERASVILSGRSAGRGRPTLDATSRKRARCFSAFSVIGAIGLLGGGWTTDDLLVLLLSQRFADALRFAQRIVDVLDRRSILEEHHALATRTLPGISAANPARLVPEFRSAPRTAYLKGVIDTHVRPRAPGLVLT
jgi:hypothetical protein